MPAFSPEAVRPRQGLLLLALLYLIFVIYGSLVPLEFSYLPVADAWARFQAIPYLNLGIGSRADWVANILLFIPLAFLWLGVCWPRRLSLRLVVVPVVWCACVVLAISIEFTQLYFPQRTVSRNDILAESIGATVGIAVWLWTGSALWRWVLDWNTARGGMALAEKVFWAYLALLFGYNLLPLDLTLSPVEIYRQWQDGRIQLLPFATALGQADPAQAFYDLLTDTALWVPVGLLPILAGRRTRLNAWTFALAAAVLLEVLQLFVYSRVSDTTDVITALLGAALGVQIGGRLGSPTMATVSRPGNRRLWWGLGAAVLWAAALVIVFWYPFAFRLDGEFVRQNLAGFFRVPFYTYYYGTEYRAATEALRKISFFIPLGLLLAYAGLPLRPSVLKTLFTVVALGLLVLIPLGVELGQVLLPGKVADSTDWLLKMLGGLGGYYGFGYFRQRLAQPEIAAVRPPPPRVQAVIAPPPRQRPSIPAVPASPGDWLPVLAVTALGWWLYLQLAPFTRLPLNSGAAAQVADHLLWIYLDPPVRLTAPAFTTPVLLAALVAFVGQGALWQSGLLRSRLLATLWLWLGLSVSGLLVAGAQALLAFGLLPAATLYAQQAGIVLGLLLWWLLGAGLSRLFRPLGTLSARLLYPPRVFLSALLLLLPLGLERPLPDLLPLPLVTGVSAYLQTVQDQVYELLKGAILWAPLGLLYALAGWQRALVVWLPAVLLPVVLMGWPVWAQWQVRDLLELTLIPWLGTGGGIWLGERLVTVSDARQTHHGQSQAPVADRAGPVPAGPAAPVAVPSGATAR